jgi:hypothetical protein
MTESILSIGLSNPKSPTNVGLIMRAAGCFQVGSVFYTGERYDRAAPFNTDTQNASLRIPLTWVPSLPGNVDDNTQVVCVELVEGATPLPMFQHPGKARDHRPEGHRPSRFSGVHSHHWEPEPGGGGKRDAV